MGTYIIGMATATIMASIISFLTPERWNRYVSVVTGIVVTICIASPLIKLINIDISAFFPEIVSTAPIPNTVFAEEMKKEMESTLAMDVRSRLKNEFGRECVAKVEVEITDTGQIAGVKKIMVRGEKIDNVAKSRLREIYGASEVVYAGY